jgi:uncharacterized membrane protein YhaH (DUF805 family)
MKIFLNPFSFHGRIRRLEYGISVILFIVLTIIFYYLFFDPYSFEYKYKTSIFVTNYRYEEYPLLALVFAFIYLLSNYLIIAQAWKRAQDMGDHGALSLIPTYNPFVLLFKDGEPYENKHGIPPKAYDNRYEFVVEEDVEENKEQEENIEIGTKIEGFQLLMNLHLGEIKSTNEIEVKKQSLLSLCKDYTALFQDPIFLDSINLKHLILFEDRSITIEDYKKIIRDKLTELATEISNDSKFLSTIYKELYNIKNS